MSTDDLLGQSERFDLKESIEFLVEAVKMGRANLAGWNNYMKSQGHDPMDPWSVYAQLPLPIAEIFLRYFERKGEV